MNTNVAETNTHWQSKYDMPLVGDTFGKLTIIEDLNESQKRVTDKVLVQCTCGEYRNVYITNLIYGLSTSCGKMTQESIDKRINTMRKKPSIYSAYLNVPHGLNNHYTLIDYTDSKKRDNKFKNRLRTFTIECPNGHQKSMVDVQTNPLKLTEYYKCWCQEPNPLSRERLRNDMTMSEVGKRFGVSRQAVELWERPTNTIPSKRLYRLYEIYNTDQATKSEIESFKLKHGGRIT